MISELKKNYKRSYESLKKKFLTDHNNSKFLRSHSHLIDQLLKKLWLNCGIKNQSSLIAVGGYGRKELFPFSDIDILVLVDSNLNSTEKIEKFIAQCWDIGLKIGHSVRDLSETISEFNKDVKTATNLLESRYLCGSKKIFKDLESSVRKEINPKKFYLEKIEEQNKRYNKYRDSGYQLEPNIKESPGGLRDVHTILWIANSQKKTKGLKDLKHLAILDAKEYAKLNFHFNQLTKIRIMLHILADSAEDRLIFDLQNKLAKLFKYKPDRNKKASELIMNRYYKSVRYINLLNEIIIKKLDPNNHKKSKISTTLPLYTYNNLIEIESSFQGKFVQYLFEPFYIFQKRKELKGLGPNLLKLINNHSIQINQHLRSNPTFQVNLLKIFKARNKVNRTLRLMNKLNILGKCIPAFGKVVGQMQHDLFHIYTVDEHTLNVIENIRRYSKDKLKHEFPLSNEIFKSFKKPYLLYLAALFHDIAKGQGGDHSILGEKIALHYCHQLGLDDRESNLVTWLVRWHLQMSQVAQKKDISDPVVIREFSDLINSKTKLRGLYLLTGADIRGTSPKVWNQWKAALLKDLYYQSFYYLDEKFKDPSDLIKIRKSKALKTLSDAYSIKKSDVKPLWDEMGDDYFYRFNESDIAWHSRALLNQFRSKKILVKIRHAVEGQGIEVLVFKKEVKDLFIKTSQFFISNELDVMQAKIYSTKSNYALDVFSLHIEPNSNISYHHFFKHIEKELAKVLNNEFIPKSFKYEKTRQAEFHNIETQIDFKKNAHGFEFSITTDSRPGLLHLFALEIRNHGLSIENAKINTLGNRVEDTFILNSGKENISLKVLKKLSEGIQNKLQ
ncbi:MAG: [protein-PII] uridylyltransferase [Methylophilaceae bacterium]